MVDEKKRLVDKSIEAFILGLELYNKPTIKYRVEGFSFFIVNAWELMLKAEMLNRGLSIYYKDNPNRTVSVDVAIRKIYSDINTRIRLNLEKVIELRNISTHYITEDYEQKYAPLFQACVLNYVNEIKRFHSVSIEDHVTQNFLIITTSYEPLENEQIKLKYAPEVAEKLIQQANEIDVLRETYDSDKFAINNTVVAAVAEKLKKESVKIDYEKGFNSYVLGLVLDFYDMKNDEMYAYRHSIGNQQQYTYSDRAVEFIVGEIKKNPDHFVESLRQRKR